jgi:hypothetical protein
VFVLYVVFYLLSGSFFGYEAVSLLLQRVLPPLTRIGIGIPCGIIAQSWFFFIMTVYTSYSRILGLFVCASFACLGLILHLIPRKSRKHERPQIIYILFAIIAPASLVLWLLQYSLFYENKYVRGDVYGDLPFQLYLISSMVSGCNRDRKSLYDMTSPFYANLSLAYPVMPNYISALMIRMFGSDIHTSLAFPSFFFAIAIFINLAAIVHKFTHGRLVACLIAPWLWIFMGGRGFLQWFNPAIRRLSPDYVHHWGGDEYNFWFQNTAHVMLPQRSSLFSLPMAFSVLLLSLHINFAKPNIRLFVAMGLVAALLPQVHPHSLLALFEYSIGLFLFNLRNFSKSYLVGFVVYAGLVGCVGLPQLLPYFSRTVGHSKGRFFEYMPLWHHRKRGPIGFWYDGLGPFIVLALFHGVIVCDRVQIMWYLPTAIVFIASNLILYQPWFMDNTKVFNAGWTPIAVSVVSNFLSKLHWIPSCILIGFCCASGSIPVSRMFRRQTIYWYDEKSAWDLGQWAIDNTHPKSVWITGDMHAHPVLCLAGRQTFMGPYNYLSNHGVDPGSRFQIMDRLKANPDDVRWIEPFKVEYVCLRDGFALKIPDVSREWKKVARFGSFTVWQRIHSETK